MRSLFSVAAASLAMAGLAKPVEEAAPAPQPKPKPKKQPRALIVTRSTPAARGSIAQGNRHGGEHQNSREVERRLRQEARRASKDGS